MKYDCAIIKRQPEDVIELVPGATEIVEIEVFNDTFMAWKPGCMITFADEQPDGCIIPLDIFRVPIEHEIQGKSAATFGVPLSMGAHVIADENRVYQMNITFRDPSGGSFGQLIPIKVKCVLPDRIFSDLAIYQ